MWERVIPFHVIENFDTSASDNFIKHCGKRTKIAHNEQFLLLPQRFHLYSIIVLSFINIVHSFARSFLNRLLQISCMWEKVKDIVLKSNGLSHNFAIIFLTSDHVLHNYQHCSILIRL